MVEKFFDTDTLSGLLAALTVASSLHLASRLFEFLWRVREKRDIATDNSVERLAAEVRQTNRHVRRLYVVVKILSGERWGTIKRAVDDEEDRPNAG